MKFIRPNDSIEFDPTDIKIFLAGPVSYVYDWQSEFAKKLESFILSKKEKSSETEGWIDCLLDRITIFSPRWNPERTMEFDFDTQFEWETRRLECADIIVFGFTKYTETPSVDRSYARTTRIEFGEALARAKFREQSDEYVFGGGFRERNGEYVYGAAEGKNKQFIFTNLSNFKDGDEYIRAKLRKYRYPAYTDWDELIEDMVSCIRYNWTVI